MNEIIIEKNNTSVIVIDENDIIVVEKGISIIGGSTSSEWGGITGDIDLQLDLKNKLDSKVSVVTGKGLSTNDYTNEEKLKLSGISGTNTGDETQASINDKIGYTPAKDNGVVHNTGNESIAGDKTFINKVTIANKTGTDVDLNLGTSGGGIGLSDANNFVLETGSTALGFYLKCGGNARFNISGNGKAFYGGSVVATARIHQDDGNATATYHKFTSGSTTGQLVSDGFDIGITGTGVAQIKQLENLNLEFFTNNTKVGDISNTGVWANNSGTWSTLSDERLKENISPVTDSLEKCLMLAKCVRHYNFKNQVKYATGKRTGYIAQLLRDNGFEGHVTYNIPVDEEEGVLLGWEYADEKYTELDNETEVEKTRRIVVKEGELILGLENNFVPYIFGAIKDLNDRLIKLENK